jgi:hypothetical protein
MKALVALSMLTLGLLLSSCSSLQTDQNPRVKFSQLKRIYVEHRLADNHHIDGLIVAELQRMGLEASAGPLTMMPERVDAIISYEDLWAWDFKTYLNVLNLTMRNAITDQPIAQATYRHNSPFPKSPERMIHEALARWFKKR